jgi:hypothetical protein
VVTRYFEEPFPVCYRRNSDWTRVLALAVRRSWDERYEVLIDLGAPDAGDSAPDTAPDTAWVPRARIRAEDPAMTCGSEPA